MDLFKQYKYLLFDLDNTLLNFSYSAEQAFKDVFKGVYSDELYHIYHEINSTYWHYFEKKKIDAQTLHYGRFDAFFKASKLTHYTSTIADDYLDALLKHSVWIDGALSILEKYAASHQMALITNGLSSIQHRRIAKHGLSLYFDHIFVSEELKSSKPNHDFFEQVHHAIGKPTKNEVLVIGDNPKSDIKGGNNFGYKTCFFHFNKLYHCKTATHTIKSWTDYA